MDKFILKVNKISKDLKKLDNQVVRSDDPRYRMDYQRRKRERKKYDDVTSTEIKKRI